MELSSELVGPVIARQLFVETTEPARDLDLYFDTITKAPSLTPDRSLPASAYLHSPSPVEGNAIRYLGRVRTHVPTPTFEPTVPTATPTRTILFTTDLHHGSTLYFRHFEDFQLTLLVILIQPPGYSNAQPIDRMAEPTQKLQDTALIEMPAIPEEDMHDDESTASEEEVEDTSLISTADLDTVTPTTEVMTAADITSSTIVSSARSRSGKKYGRQPLYRRRGTPLQSDATEEPEIPDSAVRASPSLSLHLEADDQAMDSTAGATATPVLEEGDVEAVAADDDSPSPMKQVQEPKGKKSKAGKLSTIPRRGTRHSAMKTNIRDAASEDEEEMQQPALRRGAKGQANKAEPQADASDEEEETTQPVPQRGSKRQANKPEPQDDASEEEEEKRPRKKTRLPKAAQPEDSDDEIAVVQPSVLSGRTPKVLISQADVAQTTTTWFRKKQVDIVEVVPGKNVHFVCVVKNKSLSATLKVLGTLLAGKPIVTDKWMLDSKKAKELQALDDYIHPHLLKKGHHIDRRSLFAGKYVFFTNYVAQNPEYISIVGLVKQAGALSVESGSAAKGNDLTSKSNVVLFGEDNAADVAATRLIKDYGRVVYSKAMLGQCIIRGELDLVSEEFQMSLPLGGKKKKT